MLGDLHQTYEDPDRFRYEEMEKLQEDMFGPRQTSSRAIKV